MNDIAEQLARNLHNENAAPTTRPILIQVDPSACSNDVDVIAQTVRKVLKDQVSRQSTDELQDLALSTDADRDGVGETPPNAVLKLPLETGRAAERKSEEVEEKLAARSRFAAASAPASAMLSTLTSPWTGGVLGATIMTLEFQVSILQSWTRVPPVAALLHQQVGFYNFLIDSLSATTRPRKD